jgi:DNA-directed RNA polymerase subunit M/transcription elongation factor TFIIS
MTIDFCPKCAAILVPTKLKTSEIFVCDNCGYTKLIKKTDGDLKTKEKMIKSPERSLKPASEKNQFATYKNKCKKCGYDKAQVIDAGISYSDEDNLILIRCGKCGYTERIGRRVA